MIITRRSKENVRFHNQDREVFDSDYTYKVKIFGITIYEKSHNRTMVPNEPSIGVGFKK